MEPFRLHRTARHRTLHRPLADGFEPGDAGLELDHRRELGLVLHRRNPRDVAVVVGVGAAKYHNVLADLARGVPEPGRVRAEIWDDELGPDPRRDVQKPGVAERHPTAVVAEIAAEATVDEDAGGADRLCAVPRPRDRDPRGLGARCHQGPLHRDQVEPPHVVQASPLGPPAKEDGAVADPGKRRGRARARSLADATVGRERPLGVEPCGGPDLRAAVDTGVRQLSEVQHGQFGVPPQPVRVPTVGGLKVVSFVLERPRTPASKDDHAVLVDARRVLVLALRLPAGRDRQVGTWLLRDLGFRVAVPQPNAVVQRQQVGGEPARSREIEHGDAVGVGFDNLHVQLGKPNQKDGVPAANNSYCGSGNRDWPDLVEVCGVWNRHSIPDLLHGVVAAPGYTWGWVAVGQGGGGAECEMYGPR
eukprot:m.79849 g.79849  ORF g.79849 m.79849 type:complete len:418 (-) comp19328_c0_seq2:802-2055(-)